MHTPFSFRRFAAVAGASFAATAFVTVALANHTWGNYHWARTSNPFTLKLGDNVSSAWDSYLATTSLDWSLSSVLDTAIVPGRAKGSCQPTKGRVEVCNKTYGNNGWLGIAQIWASGQHITQGTVKVNDTYFNTPAYNTPAWRNLVMCQEVGHTFGLGHQDEDFTNADLGTCMDYSNDPVPNQHPNAHDYELLETIYTHLDGSTTIGANLPSGSNAEDMANPAAWGTVLRKDSEGRPSLYERDFGNGQKVFTHVYWVDGHHDEAH
jgi:hypothetical protein